MKNTSSYNIDEETIRQVGLIITNKKINAPTAPDARVFEYPFLENVFIMENDLYGTIMPKDSCFIAFNGKHGMVGRHLSVEKLRNSSVEEIRKLVMDNSEG